MWGKISDEVVLTCSNCGRRINPYAEIEMMYGVDVETMWNRMRRIPCPECKEVGIWSSGE